MNRRIKNKINKRCGFKHYKDYSKYKKFIYNNLGCLNRPNRNYRIYPADLVRKSILENINSSPKFEMDMFERNDNPESASIITLKGLIKRMNSEDTARSISFRKESESGKHYLHHYSSTPISFDSIIEIGEMDNNIVKDMVIKGGSISPYPNNTMIRLDGGNKNE